MRYLLLLVPSPAFALDGSGDLAIHLGLVIISAAVTIYRFKRYLSEKSMSDKIQTAVDIKPIVAAVGGGALTFTAANVISLVGMCVGVIGVVLAYLQWRERRRANDIAERQAQLAERKFEFEQKQKEVA